MDDLFNYYYRAIISFSFSANAFGDDKLCDKIIKFSDEFTITSDRK